MHCFALLSIEIVRTFTLSLQQMRNNLDKSPENCKHHSTAQTRDTTHTNTFSVYVLRVARLMYAYTKHTWTRSPSPKSIKLALNHFVNKAKKTQKNAYNLSYYFFILSGQLLTHRLNLYRWMYLYVCFLSFLLSPLSVLRVNISCCWLFFTSNLITN